MDLVPQVGDQGRGGTSNQRSVALMMGQLATDCYKPQFVVSTGDNFVSGGAAAHVNTDSEFVGA